jgi:hypothetical protein
MEFHPGETIWCFRCGVEITCSGWVVGQRVYCCKDCAEGRPCDCGDRMEQEDGHRGQSKLNLPIISLAVQFIL